MKRIALFSSIAAAFTASAAFAHPGHGADSGTTLLHHFTQPEHVGVALLAIVAVVGVARAARRSR